MPDVRGGIAALMAERARLTDAIATSQARLVDIDQQLAEIRAVLNGPTAAADALAPSVTADLPPSARETAETRVITLLHERGPMRVGQVAEQLGLPREATKKLLWDMRELGVIASSGVRAGTRWHLPKEGLHDGDRPRGGSAAAHRGRA